MIDNLNYKYHGNQLIAVDDAELTDNGYDFADNGSYYNGALQEFEYDANGNATRDNNKGILSIGYNHLNLPVEVSFSKDNKLEYLYDATGTKLRQDVVVTKNLTKRTDFISNFVIVNNAPAWINFYEGLDAPHPPRPSPQGEGSYILLKMLNCFSLQRNAEHEPTISPLLYPLLEERAG